MIKIDQIRKKILKDPARHKVVVAGRRWGKTYLALVFLMSGSLEANQRRWYIAPTYRQGKMIAFPILRKLFHSFGSARLNESELSIKFENGSEIAIKGADNEDSLRGAGLDRVVLDEYATMKPHVFEEIVLPMLATTKGKSMFIGSPNGFNHFYEIYMRGQDPDDHNWSSWLKTTLDGGFVSADEIEDAKKTMDARLFRQEFQASFETAGRRAVYNFDRKIHVREGEISNVIRCGVDFNVDYMTASIFCIYTDGTIHFFDEIRLKNSNTMELADMLKRKYPKIKVYPDASGSARSTTSNRSDHDHLINAGFQVIAPKANPSHIDRLNAINAKLLDANKKIGMTISSKCIHLIKDLELVQRDKKGSIDKSDMELTHALDACSYPIAYLYPVRKIRTSTFMA